MNIAAIATNMATHVTQTCDPARFKAFFDQYLGATPVEDVHVPDLGPVADIHEWLRPCLVAEPDQGFAT
jgi:hypothetical protein